MATLQQPRKGWENEHLAKFLLSKISFLAHPITVADDIGADVVCTIFEPRDVEGSIQLFPKQAFAIQLKSKLGEVAVHGNVGYLPGLEIPFFLGFVDQNAATLSIYSGGLLPDFFASNGTPDLIKLVPQGGPIENPTQPWEKNGAGNFKVPMPLVGTMKVGDTTERFEAIRVTLLKLCAASLKNIATRINREFVFQYTKGDVLFTRILAGPGSEPVFRTNLMLRLAEGFYNLRYIFDNKPHEFIRGEFDEMEKCFLGLRALGYPQAEFVEMIYGDLKRALDQQAKP
jgi:hypothetical protein